MTAFTMGSKRGIRIRKIGGSLPSPAEVAANAKRVLLKREIKKKRRAEVRRRERERVNLSKYKRELENAAS